MILRKENKLYYGYGSSQNKILEQPLLCGVGRGSILGNGGLQPSRVDSFVPCSRRIIAISLMPSPVKPTIIICSLGSEFQINNNHYRMRYIHPDQTKKINYVLFFFPQSLATVLARLESRDSNKSSYFSVSNRLFSEDDNRPWSSRYRFSAAVLR